MEITLKYQPAFSLAFVKVAGNEQIRVEPGAMVSHTDGMVMETKAEGGLFGGLKRMVAGESFFQNTWQAPAQGGEITLAPSLPGDMFTLPISGEFLLASGAYVASEMNVKTDASWGGAKGFFGGGGLILLKVTGSGKLLAAAYGAIHERQLAAGEKYVVDNPSILGLTKIEGEKDDFVVIEGFSPLSKGDKYEVFDTEKITKKSKTVGELKIVQMLNPYFAICKIDEGKKELTPMLSSKKKLYLQAKAGGFFSSGSGFTPELNVYVLKR